MYTEQDMIDAMFDYEQITGIPAGIDPKTTCRGCGQRKEEDEDCECELCSKCGEWIGIDGSCLECDW